MYKYLKKHKWQVTVVSILLIIISLLEVSTQLIRTFSTNNLIDGNVSSFIWWNIFSFGIWMLILFLNYNEWVFESKTIQKLNTSIRTEITTDLSNSSYSKFHDQKEGAYVSWMSNDINTIEQIGFKNVFFIITFIANIVFSSISLFFFHYSLVITVVIFTILMIYIPKKLSKKLDAATLVITQENERFISKIQNVLSGFDSLFSLNLMKILPTKTKQASEELLKKNVLYTKEKSVLFVFINFLNVVSQIVIITQTGILAAFGIISIGALMTTGALAALIFNSIGQMSNLVLLIRSTKPIFAKFEQLKEEQKSEPDNDISKIESFIKLHNLGFRINDKHILKDINMEFKIGGKYAIVGQSGSGKSTILKILMGYYKNYEGTITLDKQELKNCNSENIREQIAYIEQNVYLFDTTIKNNITLEREFDTEQLQKSIENSALNQLLSELPKGLETPVGENGRNLSGGQKQRISLARNLLGNKHIVLIDEGTSSLDSKNAMEIESLLVNNKYLTVIMVTHHLNPEIKEKLDHVYEIH